MSDQDLTAAGDADMKEAYPGAVIGLLVSEISLRLAEFGLLKRA